MMYKILSALTFLLLFIQSGFGQDYKRNIEEVLALHFDPHCPAFSVLVGKGNEIIFEKVSGITTNPVEDESKYQFLIASITKQFTAVAVMQLIEKEALSLQDDVRKFVPEFLPNGPPITIRHLLNHTAGLDNQTIIPEEIRVKVESQDAMLELFKDHGVLFEPGTQYRYSNLGYMLLGHVIQNVSGMSCQAYFRKFLFEPAGMQYSDLIVDNRTYNGLIEGYTRSGEQIRSAEHVNMVLPFTGGGIISTAMDIYRWYQALMSYKIISRESLELCFTDNMVKGQPTHYGFGWMVGQLRGEKVIKHDGIISGFLSFAAYMLEEDIMVVTLCNCDNVPYLEVPASLIMAIVMDQPFEDQTESLPKTDIENVIGEYTSNGKTQYISSQNNTIVLHEKGGTKHVLIPQSTGSLLVESTLDIITLEETNKVVSGFHLSSLSANSIWLRSGTGKMYETLGLSDHERAAFVGKYQVPDAFVSEVYEEDARMYGRVGHDAHEIFCFEKDRFFAHGIDAEIHFHRNEHGEIDGFSLMQGREMKAVRVAP